MVGRTGQPSLMQLLLMIHPLIQAAFEIRDPDVRFHITNFLAQADVTASLSVPGVREAALQILTDPSTSDLQKKMNLYHLIPPPVSWSSVDPSYAPNNKRGGARSGKTKRQTSHRKKA